MRSAGTLKIHHTSRFDRYKPTVTRVVTMDDPGKLRTYGSKTHRSGAPWGLHSAAAPAFAWPPPSLMSRPAGSSDSLFDAAAASHSRVTVCPCVQLRGWVAAATDGHALRFTLFARRAG